MKSSMNGDSPAAQRRVPDFDNDIGWVDDLGQRAVLESDIQLAVENDRFHCIFRHIEFLYSKSVNMKVDLSRSPHNRYVVCSHNFEEATR